MKRTKSYCLSDKAIKRIEDVKKEHEFNSNSEALEYILLYQPNETKIKELVFETLINLLYDKGVSFNAVNIKDDVNKKVNNEVEKALLNATDDIFNNMPD